KGGRLAAVLPSDLLSADYGAPLLTYLQTTFSALHLAYCDDAVFPALSQQTILLLADGRRDEAQKPADIRFRRVRFRVEGAGDRGSAFHGTGLDTMSEGRSPGLASDTEG